MPLSMTQIFRPYLSGQVYIQFRVLFFFFLFMHGSSNLRTQLPVFRLEFSSFASGFIESVRLSMGRSNFLIVKRFSFCLRLELCATLFHIYQASILVFYLIHCCLINSSQMSFIFVGVGHIASLDMPITTLSYNLGCSSQHTIS